MEHFEGNPGKVREKSVYLLHLDTPRIIIISCVVIGIVIVSFLLGMNFIKSENKTDSIQSGLAMEEPKFPEGARPPLPGDGDNLPALDKGPTAEVSGSDVAARKDPVDILNSENIREIIPPAEKKNETEKPSLIADPLPTGKDSLNHEKKVRKTARADREKNKKNGKKDVAARERTGVKKGVVEAVNTVDDRHPTGGFMVQVASYDNRVRAQNEVNTLRARKYDAFISDTSMDGKKYYRVRIGPVADRERAVSLLKDLQSERRYEESYLVKE